MSNYSGDPVQIAQEAIIRGTERLFDILPRAVKLIIRDELWKPRKDRQGNHFKSFEAFVLHHLPEGLEIPSMDRLVDFVKDDPGVVKMVEGEMGASDTRSEAGAKGGRGIKAVDNINSFIHPKGGTGKSYLLKRLKRYNPKIAENYIQGEYPSVRQAAIAAGIVKVKTPLEQILTISKKLTNEDIEIAINHLYELRAISA